MCFGAIVVCFFELFLELNFLVDDSYQLVLHDLHYLRIPETHAGGIISHLLLCQLVHLLVDPEKTAELVASNRRLNCIQIRSNILLIDQLHQRIVVDLFGKTLALLRVRLLPSCI